MKPYSDSRTKSEQVEAMFDGIAPAYDRLNDILSLGIARRWRRAVVRGVERVASRDILDLAAGTGDMAIALAKRLPGVRVVGADPSQGMLDVARHKAPAMEFVRAQAENLPFDEGCFDAVTVAFGIRNFDDMQCSIDEIRRVLRPGGRVFILEFSTPRNRVFGAIYRFYFHRVLPRIGALLSSDSRAYTYLPGSVDEFPPPAKFVEMLVAAGFKKPRSRALTGGVAYIYTAEK